MTSDGICKWDIKACSHSKITLNDAPRVKKGPFLLVLRDLVEVFTSKNLISNPSNDLHPTEVLGE